MAVTISEETIKAFRDKYFVRKLGFDFNFNPIQSTLLEHFKGPNGGEFMRQVCVECKINTRAISARWDLTNVWRPDQFFPYICQTCIWKDWRAHYALCLQVLSMADPYAYGAFSISEPDDPYWQYAIALSDEQPTEVIQNAHEHN